MVRDEGRRRGLTLIELAVILAILAGALALLAPALRGWRESARRAGCADNLRQIARAALSYSTAQGCLPGGSYNSSAHPRNFSCLARMLPYLDQAPLYNGINMSLAHVDVENLTVGSAGLVVLFCPSDPKAARPAPAHYSGNPNSPSQIPPGSFSQHFGSYAGNAGIWDLEIDPADPNYPTRMACMNGVIYGMSAVTPADVVDGASQTFLFAERAHGALGLPTIATWLDSWTGPALSEYHFWQSGEAVDALFESWGPPNQHRTAFRPSKYEHLRYLAANASSFHTPGGANFAFCDGSVAFLKETVDSWRASNTGIPYGLAYDRRTGAWSLREGARVKVYQALSTRDGGEAIRQGDFPTEPPRAGPGDGPRPDGRRSLH